MQERRNEAKNIDIDTINNEPKILETLGLTLEEVEEYIKLQKERKKNDKMFSDVIVCKTYEDFDKQVKLIRQKGIGNSKRKVLIKQNSDGRIAFYILVLKQKKISYLHCLHLQAFYFFYITQCIV